ncbi:histone-like nucleoid-structuring protein Lsr2 [Spirillospora sp. CA-128828]|uniref:histone-like nucleoid-structuring protein Lsr2 n=1 Tax=Spirillospora sp. CA-128828 TaxID=3240033 RepID=UPI003D8CA14E
MQKIEINVIDDIDGSPAEETIMFSLDGVSFEIDLNADNAAALRDIFRPYLEHGRKKPWPGRRATTGPQRTHRHARSRMKSAEIRQWAKTRGLAINDRGRIPAYVIEEYEANA